MYAEIIFPSKESWTHSALLDSTFFSFDDFYHSTLCPIRRLLHSTLFPVDVFYHLTLCPIQRFFTFVLMSFRRFVPFDILSFQRFLPFNILSVDILSNSMYCPSTFFIVGVFYFDILSVNRPAAFRVYWVVRVILRIFLYRFKTVHSASGALFHSLGENWPTIINILECHQE